MADDRRNDPAVPGDDPTPPTGERWPATPDADAGGSSPAPDADADAVDGAPGSVGPDRGDPGAPLFPASGGVSDRSSTDDAIDASVDDGAVHHDGDAISGDGPDDDGSDDGSKARSSGGGSFLRELPVLLVVAFVLAFLLRTFVLQVFYIPSSSMEPTLQIDDRMVVEKVTYLFRDPQRGEIVVFEGESLGDVDPDASVVQRAVRGIGQFVGLVPASARDFVKRVIGLPGDEVLLEGGQVFINGEPIDEPYALLDQSDFGPVTVPDGSLFFLGDNRANSSDSRRSLGFVPLEQVVGRSVVILWPFDHTGMLTGVDYPDVPDPAGGADDTAAPSDVDPFDPMAVTAG